MTFSIPANPWDLWFVLVLTHWNFAALNIMLCTEVVNGDS